MSKGITAGRKYMFHSVSCDTRVPKGIPRDYCLAKRKFFPLFMASVRNFEEKKTVSSYEYTNIRQETTQSSISRVGSLFLCVLILMIFLSQITFFMLLYSMLGRRQTSDIYHPSVVT